MKISDSKKELAKIISENGGWREGAKWAAQDGVGDDGLYNVAGYGEKPVYEEVNSWHKPFNYGAYYEDWFKVSSAVNGWRQTILQRAEYFRLYPAPDADGWIGWSGGERPIAGDELVVLKMRDNSLWADGVPRKAECMRWCHEGYETDIIAYRLHKPEQETESEKLSHEAVLAAKNSLMSDSIEELARKPTIEELAADYRNKLDYASRKQDEAENATVEADVALSELEMAIAAIGFAITPICAVAHST